MSTLRPTTGQALRPALGVWQATALVVGIIIGASIFVQPSEITRQMPSITGIILVWLAAGALTMCGALVCAELASAYPRTGGVYAFLVEIYSPLVGFLWGWAMFWSMHSAIIAAIAMIFARYAGYFVPIGDIGTRLVAVGVIGVLTAVNYIGVKHGGRVQAIFTGVKLAAIAILIFAGLLITPHTLSVAAPTAVAGTAAIGLQPFILALVAGLFAYGGWHMVTYAAGETINPARTIPRALVVGICIVTLCYAGLNAMYLRVLPLDAVRASTRVAADAAAALMGSRSAGLITVLVLVSTFGAVNGVILAGPRVYFSMAQDGLLFRSLGVPHPRFHTPHRALLLQGLWAAVLAFTNQYGTLVRRIVSTEWVFFAMLAVGLMLLRRRAGYDPPYRVTGYPLVPLLFAAVSLLIVVVQARAEPVESAIGFALVMAGVPVYWLWSRMHPRRI